MRNRSWVKGILSLYDSFKCKRNNKLCRDVPQTHRLTLKKNTTLHMKPV